MNKQHIIDEIKRPAEANIGIALGREAFLRETGIKQSDWYGKFWARWGDALSEAGFSPNQMQNAFPDELLIEKYIGLIRELGHFPVEGELRLKARRDPEFPSRTTFARLGSKQQLVVKIFTYCEGREGYDDVVSVCRSFATPPKQSAKDESLDQEVMGFVYLLQSGRYFKIGKTNAAGRRERELAIQLPGKAKTVHVIRTDDPTGIEAYWHKRSESKHKNGEWFELSAADVKAFKRRKFM